MKIAVCDDEITVLDEVTSYIKKYSEFSGIRELDVVRFQSVASLVSSLEDGAFFDIFFLDVYIGDGLGTDVARTIRKKGIESPIIFLTTSIDHAPESLEFGTLRYLIKPINHDKFFEAMNVAVQKSKKLGSKFIILKTENGVENINISNILYSESHAHYQYVNFTGGDRVRARMTVTELFEELSRFKCFVRAGSAYIINLQKVKSVSTSDVCFSNNTRLSLPRGSHNDVKEAFWKLQYDSQEV